MTVNLTPPSPSDLHPVAGLSLGTAMAGVRKANRRDVTVVTLDAGASVAGVFTSNRFCAAPVQLCREHLSAGGDVRAILVNTGNANAGTGAAQKRFAVNTPATVEPSAMVTTVRSRRLALRTPAIAMPISTPGTGCRSAGFGAARFTGMAVSGAVGARL